MELEELSVVEKAAMLSGGSEWDSRGNDRADIPSFVMSDGPHGVRRQLGEGDHLGIGASKPATCFPTAGTVANSWDPALAEEMGESLGSEAHDLDVNVLLGPGGFKKQISGFNVERLGNASRALALGRHAFNLAREHAMTRKQFGRELCDFQGIQWKFADMAMKLEQAQMLLYRAALEGRIKAFTGLDSPYEAPIKADCEINTEEVELLDAVDRILAALFKK